MKTITTIFALLVALGLAPLSNAGTIDVLLGDQSSVELTSTSTWGVTPSISADLVAGLSDFEYLGLDEGESWEFDFFDITVDSDWIAGGSFDISATIDFDSPVLASTFGGDGDWFTIMGVISGGVLTWDPNFTETLIGDSLFRVELENLSVLGLGDTATVHATVTNVGVAAVPEPSTLVLMATGLLGLGLGARKKRAAV